MRQMMRHALSYNWWLYLGAFLVVIPAWVPALDPTNVNHEIRLPLYVAFLSLFVMALSAAFGPASPRASKVLSTLPLSRRQRGLATWCMAVAVPVTLIVLGTLTATGLMAAASPRSTVDGRWLVFLCACEFAYAGTIFFLWTTSAGAAPRILRRVLVACFSLAVLGGWFAVARYIPTSSAQVTIWAWLAVMNGLVLTVAGYARSTRLAFYGASARTGQVSNTADGGSPDRAPFRHRLSGVVDPQSGLISGGPLPGSALW